MKRSFSSVVEDTGGTEINLWAKLYGEVNSVKKHNYKLWLNDGVY